MNTFEKKKRLYYREWPIYISFRKRLVDFQNKIVSMDFYVFVRVSSVSRKRKHNFEICKHLYFICHWFYEDCFLEAF